MAFNLYYGSKIENLVTELWDRVIKSQELPVLKPRCIVIQNQGMAACIKQTLAEYVGICANFEFPFLAKFLGDTLKENLKMEERASAIFHSKEKMIAKIYTLISTEFLCLPEITAYLAGEATPQKKIQLSMELASLFDQYQIFRLEEVLKWEEGVVEEGNWQAKIYKRVASEGVSRARELKNFLELESVKKSGEIILFGVSTMAPIFLELLKKISHVNTVHFFLMSPTYITNERAKEANPLLIAYGTQHLEFTTLCANSADNIIEVSSHGSGNDTLSLLKNSVLDNQKEMQPCEYKNIIISKCHTISREIETLFDELLYAVEREEIYPRDVLVMTPSISEYAPFIKAIFDRRNYELSRSERALNYTITDIPLEEGGSVLSVVDRLLNYSESEFSVTGLFDILGMELISEKFEFTHSEMNYLKQWIHKTGIRWGIDAKHRKEISGFAFSENSFNSGIDILLLNLMMKLNFTDIIFDGHGVTGIDFGVKQSLEKFIKIFRTLENCHAQMVQVKGVEAFATLVEGLVEAFIPLETGTFKEINLITRTLKKVREADFEVLELNWRSLREFYTMLLGKESISTGFLRGKITFCSMQPMRGIPSKFIALLGMNEGCFPRKEGIRNFSLLKERQCGDRSQILEERYIFLEILFSVRSKLLISYIGSDSRKQEERLPSVVVQELKEFINEKNGIFKEHTLHGHNPKYFMEGDELFTYSRQSYESMRERQKFLGGKEDNVVISQGVASEKEVTPAHLEVTLKELTTFFMNPSKAFARSKGISLESRREISKNFEPLKIEGLDKYEINQEIMQGVLEGESATSLKKRLYLHGKAPVQELGSLSLGESILKIAAILEEPLATFELSLKEVLKRAERRTVEFKGQDYTLTGELEPILDGEMLFARIQSESEKLKLSAWIHYLVAVACGNATRCDYFVKKEPTGGIHKSNFLKECSQAEACEMLSILISLFREGHTHPLEYFIEASSVLFEKGKEKAIAKFSESDQYSKAENEDDYISLFFTEEIFEEDKTLEIAEKVVKYIEKKEKKGAK
ncbi:MAG: exodeoxyribonuclease V subunit gamma [Fusobacteria bacterium]|nr:exodeoxyribonuclease V subunit gamma [Fusobacteriota bacterium]